MAEVAARHPSPAISYVQAVVGFDTSADFIQYVTFEVLRRYSLRTSIGSGGCSFVAEAIDNEEAPDEDGEPKKVAIKKVEHLCDTQRHWVCASRELAMMLYFNHPNVMSARDMFIPLGRNITWQSIELRKKSFQEVYIVMDLLDRTLRYFISSQDIVEGANVELFPCRRDHRQWLLFQLLCGLNCLHQCGVVHRDLKPENVLIDCHWNLRLYGFGRSHELFAVDAPCVSGFVNCQTQLYSAPETLAPCSSGGAALLAHEVTPHADVWSCGCMAAEMLIGRPLFASTTALGSLPVFKCIIEVLGCPSETDLSSIGSAAKCTEEIKSFLANKHVFPTPLGENQLRKLLHSPLGEDEESPEEVDLIMKMLRYNPRERITAQEALKHPFFEGFEPPEFEAKKFPFKTELVNEAAAREYIWGLFTRRHPEVLALLKPSEPAELLPASTTTAPS